LVLDLFVPLTFTVICFVFSTWRETATMQHFNSQKPRMGFRMKSRKVSTKMHSLLH